MPTDIKTIHIEGGENVPSSSSGSSPSSSGSSTPTSSKGGSSRRSSISESSSVSSTNTIDLLGGDPLFLVLSQYFMTNKQSGGKNIADVMEGISDKLSKILTLLENGKK